MRTVFAGTCKKLPTGLLAAQIHYILHFRTSISSFYLRRRHKMTSFTCLNSINMQSTLMSKVTSRKAFSGALVPSPSRAMPVRHQLRTVIPQALFTKNKTKNEVYACLRCMTAQSAIVVSHKAQSQSYIAVIAAGLQHVNS